MVHQQVDSGMQLLEAQLRAAGDPRFTPRPDADGPGIGIDVAASLNLSVGNLVRRMEVAERRKQKLIECVRYVPIMPVSAAVAGGAVLLSSNEWTPKTGFWWSVQRITAAGLATADILGIYRGPQPTAQAPPVDVNLVQKLTGTSVLAQFGGNGLIMTQGDTLSLYQATGLTATQVTVNFDVIMGTDDVLADFLL